jgi:hypothetical protein
VTALAVANVTVEQVLSWFDAPFACGLPSSFPILSALFAREQPLCIVALGSASLLHLHVFVGDFTAMRCDSCRRTIRSATRWTSWVSTAALPLRVCLAPLVGLGFVVLMHRPAAESGAADRRAVGRRAAGACAGALRNFFCHQLVRCSALICFDSLFFIACR